MTGVSSLNSSNPTLPRAIVRGRTAASPRLGPLVDEWGDKFEEEVLKKWLPPTDCALLARAGSAARRWRRRRRWGSRARKTSPWCRSRSMSFSFSGPSSDWLGRWRTGAVGGEGLCGGRYKGRRRLEASGGRGRGSSAACGIRRHPTPPLGDGHLDVLQWAREHDCPWDEKRVGRRWGRAPGRVAVGMAARLPIGGGHFSRRRLRAGIWCCGGRRGTAARGMRRCCTFTAQGGHPEELRWAREYECP